MSKPVNGLVLTGGLSQRMGTPKALLNYHGKPQQAHLFDLLSAYCHSVFLACNAQQSPNFPRIIDAYPNSGPMGALLSAFEQIPDVAWLVVACDMPFVSTETIEVLLNARTDDTLFTAFMNAETMRHEPLLTLYEPAILPVLQTEFQNQKRSLSKVLEKNEGKVIIPPDARWLININTPESYHAFNL